MYKSYISFNVYNRNKNVDFIMFVLHTAAISKGPKKLFRAKLDSDNQQKKKHLSPMVHVFSNCNDCSADSPINRKELFFFCCINFTEVKLLQKCKHN